MHPTNIIFQASLEVNKMISDRADDSCSRSSGGDHVVGGLENTSEKRGGSGKNDCFRGDASRKQ